MVRTLVFCTSFSRSAQIWTLRYRLWLNAILGGEIGHDHVLLIDDASPVPPDWTDVRITNDAAESLAAGQVTLYRFDRRLGRQARTVYPGWYRSFCFAARFAEIHGFGKVVHIESDAFIISSRMQRYIKGVSDGWIAPAIESHDMPESAIQIMAGGGLQSFIRFASVPYSACVGLEAENIIPFTRVERAFIGSRYGETLHHVPGHADFVTQTNPAWAGRREYFWWLKPEVFPFP